jgi:hypothetical protein
LSISKAEVLLQNSKLRSIKDQNIVNTEQKLVIPDKIREFDIGELCSYKSKPCVTYFQIKNQPLPAKGYVQTVVLNQLYRMTDRNAEQRQR